MSAVIEIKDLEFSYTRRSPRLSIPLLRVDAGEHAFIKGPSGSGKSTLLGLLSGMLKPQAGFLRVAGQDLLRMNSRERDAFRGRSIGYLSQQFNLIPFLSARDNICLPIRLHRKALPATECQTRLEELLEIMAIAPFVDRKASELSVGQQQRVAAARAFVLNPALVIADEPTSSLDEVQKNRLIACLMDMAQHFGSTLIMASHDLSLISGFVKTIDLREFSPYAF